MRTSVGCRALQRYYVAYQPGRPQTAIRNSALPRPATSASALAAFWAAKYPNNGSPSSAEASANAPRSHQAPVQVRRHQQLPSNSHVCVQLARRKPISWCAAGNICEASIAVRSGRAHRRHVRQRADPQPEAT